MADAPTFSSTKEALVVLTSVMGIWRPLMPRRWRPTPRRRCLQLLEKAGAMGTAARASILGAFTSAQGYVEDADHSARAWLMHKTRVSRGAAAGHVGWARRVAVHPQIVAALAAGELSESYGWTIAKWTDKLPEDCRPAADAILLGGSQVGDGSAGSG